MIKSMTTLCNILRVSESYLKKIISNIDSYYGEYRQPKFKANGERRLYPDCTPRDRIINPPIEKLKKLQKKIANILVAQVPLPVYQYGGIKGRSNIGNAKLHKGKKFVFQTDLTDFFPYIHSNKVYKALIDLDFSPNVASLITKLTTYKGHLPQGAPTSSILANIVFIPTGNKILKIAENNNLNFSIFVDDVTLSSNSDFKQITYIIIDIIRADGYKISQNKTTYKSGIKEVTGVKLPNNTMTTTSKFDKKYITLDSSKIATKRGMDNYKKQIKKSLQ